MVYSIRTYPFNMFKGCLPQNLLSPLLNTSSHLYNNSYFVTRRQSSPSLFLSKISVIQKDCWGIKLTLENLGSSLKTTKTWKFQKKKENKYFVISRPRCFTRKTADIVLVKSKETVKRDQISFTYLLKMDSLTNIHGDILRRRVFDEMCLKKQIWLLLYI